MTGWLLLVAVCMHAMHVPSLPSPPVSAAAGVVFVVVTWGMAGEILAG